MCEHENMKMIRQCNWNLNGNECGGSIYAASSTARTSVAGIFAFGSSWLGSGFVGGLIVIFPVLSVWLNVSLIF